MHILQKIIIIAQSPALITYKLQNNGNIRKLIHITTTIEKQNTHRHGIRLCFFEFLIVLVALALTACQTKVNNNTHRTTVFSNKDINTQVFSISQDKDTTLTGTNGQSLESGGMIYINATSDDYQLKLGINKTIDVGVPSDNILNDIKIYEGELKDNQIN